jgi:hypothetical protein
MAVSARPDEEITRTEMAMIRAQSTRCFANALGLSLEANTATGFPDDKDILAWAKGAVAAIRKLGLIEGRRQRIK